MIEEGAERHDEEQRPARGFDTKRIDYFVDGIDGPGGWLRLSEATKQEWRDNAYP